MASSSQLFEQVRPCQQRGELRPAHDLYRQLERFAHGYHTE